MKRTDLSSFIKNMKALRDNPMVVYKQTIVELIFAILWQMAKYQIVDTGHGRSLIIGAFASKYGFEYGDLDEYFWDYWKNYKYHGRDWWSEPSKTSMSESENKQGYSLDLAIKDWGVFMQEVGNLNYPSEEHAENTGRDNSQFKPRHITYVQELINSGNYGELRKLDYNKLVNDLCKAIENKLFSK